MYLMRVDGITRESQKQTTSRLYEKPLVLIIEKEGDCEIPTDMLKFPI